jgi:hypothetical protein
MPREEIANQRAVSDLTPDESVARVVMEVGQVRRIPGVREPIEVHHGFASAGEPPPDEVAADEAGGAGSQDHRRPEWV